MRRELNGLVAALANTVAEIEEKEIPKFRFDGEPITSAEEVAVALGISVIEAKARIRRVRTQSGVRKYGQPLGSIITEDLVPHASMPNLPGKASVWKTATTEGSVRGYQKYDLQDDDRYIASISRFPGQSRYSVQVHDKKTGYDYTFISISVEGGRRAFEAHRDRTYARENVRRVKPKSKKRFVDQESWGTYGKDWWYGSEDEQGLPDWSENGITDRRRIAMHATEQLGVKLDVEQAGANMSFDLHPKFHEVFNEYMMSMEGSFPGITSVITNYGTAEYGNSLAFNAQIFPRDAAGDRELFGNTTSGIFFSPSRWGTNSTYTGELKGWSQEGNQHWSYRASEMNRFSHLDDRQRMFLAVTAHEVGHTVARMVAFDEARGWHARMTMDKEDRNYYRQMFWWDASTIMENHGLGDANEIYEAMAEEEGNKDAVGLISSRVQNVLSNYGGTNLHEMLAEVWAEYQLDPEPRSFAAEMGAAMEATMEEWLYWNTKSEE